MTLKDLHSSGVSGVLLSCESTLRTPKGRSGRHRWRGAKASAPLSWVPQAGEGEAELKGGRQGFRCRERAGAEVNGNTMGAPQKGKGSTVGGEE